MPKDFIRIADLGAEFRERSEDLRNIADSQQDDKTKAHLWLLIFATESQIAVAQQLAMISQRLGEIVSSTKPRGA